MYSLVCLSCRSKMSAIIRSTNRQDKMKKMMRMLIPVSEVNVLTWRTCFAQYSEYVEEMLNKFGSSGGDPPSTDDSVPPQPPPDVRRASWSDLTTNWLANCWSFFPRPYYCGCFHCSSPFLHRQWDAVSASLLTTETNFFLSCRSHRACSLLYTGLANEESLLLSSTERHHDFQPRCWQYSGTCFSASHWPHSSVLPMEL